MKELDVVAAVIRNDGKILCMQRAEGKNKETSFKWEFPGGKIEEGETGEIAIKREIQEELEMDIDIIGVIGQIDHTFEDFVLHMTCYNCVTKSTDIKLIDHIAYKWLEPHELLTLDWSPSDLNIVKVLGEDNDTQNF